MQAWRKGVVQGVEGLSVWCGVHMLKGSILDGKGIDPGWLMGELV